MLSLHVEDSNMIKTLELVLIGEERYYRCYCDSAISDTMCVLNPVWTQVTS